MLMRMEQSDRLTSPAGVTAAPRGASRARASMARAARAIGFGAVASTLLAVGGCRLEMYDQPRQKPYSVSTFFEDSSASRPLIPGTVPHGMVWTAHTGGSLGEASGGMAGENGMEGASMDSTGPQAQTNGVAQGTKMPFPVTKKVLLRGQERFNIYCSPCHGRTGEGNGMIVQRGFPAPPSFHIDRLRTVDDYHFVDVITNGFGRMYNYAARVPIQDRWAITAYIRALQLSQHATAQDVSSAARNK